METEDQFKKLYRKIVTHFKQNIVDAFTCSLQDESVSGSRVIKVVERFKPDTRSGMGKKNKGGKINGDANTTIETPTPASNPSAKGKRRRSSSRSSRKAAQCGSCHETGHATPANKSQVQVPPRQVTRCRSPSTKGRRPGETSGSSGSTTPA